MQWDTIQPKKKKKKEYVKTWMNFKEIILSEIIQSQKDKYCMSLLTYKLI